MTHQQPPLSERDEEIITAVHTYRYLTLDQVTRLFFGPASKNYAGQYLLRLTKYGMLARFPLPTSQKGNRSYIYTLSSKGTHYLRSIGWDIAGRSTEEPPSYKHLTHTLAVNDFLIAATLLPRNVEGVTLRNLYSEWMLKCSPLRLRPAVETGRSQSPHTTHQQSVIPDGWLDFRLRCEGKTIRFAVWVEIDLQTEEEKQFRQKVRSLHTIATSNVCLQQLGVKAFTIAIANMHGGVKRRDQLRGWAKQELILLGKLADASLFLFTSLPDGELNPQMLFLTPSWVSICEDRPLPLLDFS
jgi:hypothetical protein